MVFLLARATRRTTLAHVRHVTPVRPAAAHGLVSQVYRQVERDFGMLAPPISLHSPAPGPLAAVWVMLRESLVATGLAARQGKEAVAATISRANSCPYCVEVHGATLRGLLRDPDSAAVAEGRLDGVTDPALRALAGWARGEGPAPFPAAHAPELLGVAVTFHYVNRMVNVFLQESPFPAHVPAAVLPRVRGFAARLMGTLAKDGRTPGAALDLLPAAKLPDDLRWAADRPTVAEAFARGAAAIEAAGEHAVPDRVRELVLNRLAAWDGTPLGLGARGTVEDAVHRLPAGERAAGRLALLTALASYQVTDAVVGEFRPDSPDDRSLVELTSWASFAAARRIGLLLHGAAPGHGPGPADVGRVPDGGRPWRADVGPGRPATGGPDRSATSVGPDRPATGVGPARAEES
ncbi:carboxymuconolactone decarboxylase family protein [Longispora sp. K20-0274]|uniref:carboxymuconolactone decarboxylase family protein n=1 Tax=Longispora sp. K20-0274 TaxID=3088255 RepID=UPI0039995F83